MYVSRECQDCKYWWENVKGEDPCKDCPHNGK